MAQLKNLDVSELDFDDIKTNLIKFLNSQSEFSDYDFEGSALSVLVDNLSFERLTLIFTGEPIFTKSRNSILINYHIGTEFERKKIKLCFIFYSKV